MPTTAGANGRPGEFRGILSPGRARGRDVILVHHPPSGGTAGCAAAAAGCGHADGESSWQPPAVLLIFAHIDALMLPYLAAPIHLPTVSIEPWRAEHLEW